MAIVRPVPSLRNKRAIGMVGVIFTPNPRARGHVVDWSRGAPQALPAGRLPASAAGLLRAGRL